MSWFPYIPTTADRQVDYAIFLMRKAGFRVDRMDEEHQVLGATADECTGRVVDWLSSMDHHQISDIVKKLKSRTK
jgi:hypothetical protein